MQEIANRPIAKAEMLIRRPVAEAFEAFVDPAITSKFWFSKGSGRLEIGNEVTWDWEMYNFSVPVKVKEVEQNVRIVVEWLAYGAPTSIEWVFTARPDGTTFVSVTNSGFTGSDAEVVQHALDATEGFAFVLAGAKAYLEHKIQLNVVPDRFPDGLTNDLPEPIIIQEEQLPRAPGSEPVAAKSATLPEKPEDWPIHFELHLNAGDLDSVMSLYEPGARFVTQSGEILVGRDQIRKVIGGLIQSRTRMTARVLRAIVLHDLAVLYTDFQGTTVDDSGETIDFPSKAVELLRRQPDGTWKLIVGDPNARGGTVS